MWNSFVAFLHASPQAAAALIAAAASLIVAVLAQLWNPIAARRLERQKTELQARIEEQKTQLQVGLEEQKSKLQAGLEETKAAFLDINSARSARRDYEYEARKRLYEQIEPLLFQLYEAIERAYACVQSLARTSRIGKLGGDGRENWLGDEGYYLYASIHRLLLPAVFFRIIQRRMTFVDLDVDRSIRTRYQLLKMYVWSFTDDFDFAKLAPALPYDPNNENWRQKASTDPAVYKRQGIVVGYVDNAVDAMLVEEDKILRPMTFGEFQVAMHSGTRPAAFNELVYIYRAFDPSSRPVLARMVRTQGCIARLLLDSYTAKPDADLAGLLQAFIDSPGFTKDFSWSPQKDLGPEDGDLVKAYVLERLERIPRKGSEEVDPAVP